MTGLSRIDKMKQGISTHTLTWSVTVNPAERAKISLISTHTLTWSVTADILSDCFNDGDFNSHAHVERDIPLQNICALI